MRLKAIAVVNIGGLVDQRIELPDAPLVAFAGPNGTGKSKLLAAIIGLWAGSLPTPREAKKASATLEVEFTEEEQDALTSFSNDMGWPPQSQLVNTAKLIATRVDVRGFGRSAEPQLPKLTEFAGNAAFLQRHASLNPVYLPAERRLLAPVRGCLLYTSRCV